MARLQDLYKNDIAKAMAAKFNLDNPMAIPKLTKIVVNMGVGRATQDKAVLESAVDSLGQDQRPEAGGDQGQDLGRRVSGSARGTTSAARSRSAADGCTSSSTD